MAWASIPGDSPGITKATALTTTNATAVLAGESGETLLRVRWLNVANSNAAGRTVSLHFYDGTTAHPIHFETAVGAKSRLPLDDIDLVLKAGQELRATASVANDLSVVLTYSRFSRRSS